MIVACRHSRPYDHPHQTTCAAGLGNGHPSRGACEHVCRLGERMGRMVPDAVRLSSPAGQARQARAMYPEPTPEQVRVLRWDARATWPRLARLLAWLRRPGEAGIGSTLKRLLAKVGGDVSKAWYVRITGRTCGCDDRARRLNEMYPYAATRIL